ncbi:hypothetical protein FKM82_014749 [Ascaphus truei]
MKMIAPTEVRKTFCAALQPLRSFHNERPLRELHTHRVFRVQQEHCNQRPSAEHCTRKPPQIITPRQNSNRASQQQRLCRV